jgi:hypothetical protein
LVQHTICDAAATVRDSLSSASNPQKKAPQTAVPELHFFPARFQSQFSPVSPSICYDSPRPPPTTSLPNHHSYINLCPAVHKAQAHNILCRTVLWRVQEPDGTDVHSQLIVNFRFMVPCISNDNIE